MNRIFTFLIALLFLEISASAQWEAKNPGAGGQVQDVVCDPNTAGRLFLASDMEGIYESTDNGQSWHTKGDFLQNRVYAVAVTPGNSNKMYVGTLYGLEVSSDAGSTFSFVENTRKISISAIAVDPNNSNIVLAGIGWRDDYDFSNYFGLTEKGSGQIFRSTDGGVNWSTITFDTNTDTDRNVFTIQFDKNNSSIVYLGSAKGIYKSLDGGATWSSVAAPVGAVKNRGVSLTPDGKTLYGAFLSDDDKRYMFASPTSAINWQQITAGFGVNISNLDVWYPEVDTRSTGSAHKVIVSLQGQRDGLFEGTFIWSGTTLSSYYWTKIWSGTDGYDNGWDNAPPNPRFVHYTPVTWDRAIWSTTNQTIFQGIPNGNKYSWHNQYSVPNYNFKVNHWGVDWATYSSRGTQSTYTYDVAVHDNYIIQGQGDNGLVESWDNGFSWSNIKHRTDAINLSDVQAVDVGDAWGTPAIVAQATGGYGGGAQDGRLYAKKLSSHSPTDEWVMLAGGPEWKGGLASGVLRDVAVSPAKPSRVYMFSSGFGLYMLDDIGWGLNQVANGDQAWCSKISNGIVDNVYTAKKIAPHPTNMDIVYFNATGGDEANQGVYKGVNAGGAWVWTKVYNGSGWDSEVTAWEHNGQVYLFFSGKSNEAGSDGNNFVGALSLDEGATWTTVLSKSQAIALRTNAWYSEIKDDFKFENKGGIVGYENHVIMSYYDHKMQKTYGIFKGTIETNGSVTWEDWTGDIHFGGLTSSIVAQNQGKKYVYSSTAGAGAWRRPLTGGTVVSPPTSPSNLQGNATSSSENELSWNDNSDNETAFQIERKEAGGSFLVVGAVGAGAISYVDAKLKAGTTYTYRVLAYNLAGNSTYTAEVVITTDEELPCEGNNIIVNGEFNSVIDPWIFYTQSTVTADIAIVNDAGFSGSSAKVNITTALSTDSDIQLYTNLPVLQNGKSYEVFFKAKASGTKTIRVGVLKNVVPWSNFLSKDVSLTTDSKTYGPIEFTMTETDDNARLDFFVGKNTMAVWLDSVVVREKCSSNESPVISLTAPLNDEIFVKGGTILLTAMADDEDGSIAKVEFYNGTTLLGTSTEEPFFYAWVNAEVGEYAITAKATDDQGLSTVSDVHTIEVVSKLTCVYTNLVANPEFDRGVAEWNFYKIDAVNSTMVLDKNFILSGESSAKISTTTIGSTDSDIQFYTAITNLKKSKTYEVFFKAKVDADTKIRVGVLKNVDPWTNFLSVDVNLKSNIKTYGPLEFAMDVNDTDSRLDFFLGNKTGDIYLDSIIIREKCVEEPILGVEESEYFAKLYPNPVKNNSILYIELAERNFDVEIINLLGQTVQRKQFLNVESGKSQLDISKINQGGIYLVRFRTNKKNWSQRLVIQNP